MKRLIGITVIVLAAAALSGCAQAKQAKSAESSLSENQYVQLVRENVPALSGATDKDLQTIGTSTCTLIDGDNGWLLNVKNLTSAGLTGYEAGQTITYAVATYCPDMKSKEPNQ